MDKISRRAIVSMLVILLLFLLIVPVVQAMELKASISIGGNTHLININTGDVGNLEENLFQQINVQLQEKLKDTYPPSIIIHTSRVIASSFAPAIERIMISRFAPLERADSPEKKPEPKLPRDEAEQGQLSDPGDAGEVQGLTADEQQMVNLVNAERKKKGLPDFKIDMDLVRLARQKSRDMVENNYFSHHSPTYASPFDMMRNAGICYRYAGENIAGAPTVKQAHISLMNSPGHRANILDSNFTHIGIGIVCGSRYGKIFTQMFTG